jgi:hypothetical protein
VVVLKVPTMTRAHHLRLHNNRKIPGALNCRMGRTRKLLLVSRWRPLIDAIQMLHWIRPKLTCFRKNSYWLWIRTLQERRLHSFLYSKFAQGVFWITCANEHSKTWLIRKISGLVELWEGAELAVVDSKDLPKRPRVLVHIPGTSEVTTVIKRLRIQNSELKWQIGQL